MAQAVKFYTDEHIAKAVVRGLRARGVDVLTAVDAGMMGATDEAHLQRALEESRVVVTEDDDFLRLHDQGKPHAGIAFAPRGRTIGEWVRGLMLIFQVLDADEMRDHVEFI